MKFYVCNICGNLIEMIEDSRAVPQCCGQKMTELIPNTSDGAFEKHVPIHSIHKNKVSVAVGSQDHPMLENHYIQWIAIETKKGTQRKDLYPGDSPCIVFYLTEDDSVLKIYAYCNLHGLWEERITDEKR